MSDLLSRVQEVQRTVIPERLRRGAEVLGKLWKGGSRCLDGWRGTCRCRNGGTAFCGAKRRWIGLLRELHRGEWPYGLTGMESYAVIQAMTASQSEATGLTILVEVPGARRSIRFCKGGTHWLTLVDLAIANDPEAIEWVVKVQEVMD